jgi:DNA-binding response OmpR family regulator
MPNVLIVHESETVRGDLNRALLAEGFTVLEAENPNAAIREIWSGSFDAALISTAMPRVSGVPLEEHLRNLAPEIVTLDISREPAPKLAKKLAELLEGGAVAA